MIFETHAHYDDEAFEQDREEILKTLHQSGVGFVINVSASLDSIKTTLSLTKQYSFIYGSVGVHPDETKDLNEENFAWLKEMTKEPKVVAIGEIGLDYYWDATDRDVQKKWFDRQMELAKEVDLPAIIHSREAAKDTLDMIVASNLKEVGGIIHCFSYGKDIAKSYLDMGFYLGIGGVVTFKNAKKLKEVVEYAPMGQLVLETDSPYLAPEPNRGKRNTSANLIYVAKEIANIKNMDYEDVIAITEENAKKLYRV